MSFKIIGIIPKDRTSEEEILYDNIKKSIELGMIGLIDILNQDSSHFSISRKRLEIRQKMVQLKELGKRLNYGGQHNDLLDRYEKILDDLSPQKKPTGDKQEFVTNMNRSVSEIMRTLNHMIEKEEERKEPSPTPMYVKKNVPVLLPEALNPCHEMTKQYRNSFVVSPQKLDVLSGIMKRSGIQTKEELHLFDSFNETCKSSDLQEMIQKKKKEMEEKEAKNCLISSVGIVFSSCVDELSDEFIRHVTLCLSGLKDFDPNTLAGIYHHLSKYASEGELNEWKKYSHHFKNSDLFA